MQGQGVGMSSDDDDNTQKAVTSVQCTDRPTQANGEGPQRAEQHQQQEEKKGETTVPLLARLLLSSELLGGEAGLSFSQLYTFPDLQTLGMPLSLVSLTGLISGPIAILLLPLMGWYSDKGPNPTRRRAVMVIISTVILASGAVTVITANLLYAKVCHAEAKTSINTPDTKVPAMDFMNAVYSHNNCLDGNCTLLQSSAKSAFNISVSNPFLGENRNPQTTTFSSKSSSSKSLRESSSESPSESSIKSSSKSSSESSSQSSSSKPLSKPSTESSSKPSSESSSKPPSESSINSSSKSSSESSINSSSKSSSESSIKSSSESSSESSSSKPSRKSSSQSSSQPPSQSSSDPLHSACLEAVPGLALLGFVLMELGYDCGMSAVKTWMLTCSPPSGAAAALVTGLVMTSLGGMLTAGLGMLDLTSLLGLTSVFQPGLTLQASIQASVIVVLLLAGMVLALLTGYRLRKHLNLDGQKRPGGSLLQDALSRYDQEIIVDTNEQSRGSIDFAAYDLLGSESQVLVHSDFNSDSVTPKDMPSPRRDNGYETALSEIESGRGNDSRKSYEDGLKDEEASARLRRVSLNYGTIGGGTGLSSESGISPRTDLSHDLSSSRDMLLTDDDDGEQDLCLCQRRRSFKATIAILWLSAYFGVGATTVYVLTVSDFVGKAIFAGDPGAPPGSNALSNYQKGLRVASYGVLVNYGAYLAFSFVQKRVLNCLGETMAFVTITLLLAVCMVVLALAENTVTFFLLSAVAGVHKAIFHVVPIAAMSDLVHAEAKRRGDGKGPQIGAGMSLIVGALPASYCSLYPWVGAVIKETGVLATSLLLAAVYSCLSAAFFFTLGL